jgi:two-component system OmpR family response regulator
MPAICRVLVIEDDAAVGDVVATVLADEGYGVRTASNGRMALSLLSAWPPDLLVLDLCMPDMDGWTFRLAQRESGFANLPVLVLTAAQVPEGYHAALDAPVLKKPFDLEDLLTSVQLLSPPVCSS